MQEFSFSIHTCILYGTSILLPTKRALNEISMLKYGRDTAVFVKRVCGTLQKFYKEKNKYKILLIIGIFLLINTEFLFQSSTLRGRHNLTFIVSRTGG